MMVLGITLTEWVGYFGSILLIISVMMRNFKTLRIINSVGASLFVAYGFMLSISWPIIITNGFIILVNIYNLTFKQNKI